MTARSLAVAACVLAATACSDPATVTVLFVTVDARPGVTQVEQIDVTLHNDTASVSQTFSLGGNDFPVTFTVTPTDREGDVRVEVVGLDGGGGVRGEGSSTGTIVPDDRVDVEVLLDPADFPINEEIAGTQRLTFEFEATGRQLAGSSDGFFATFVNDCAMLGRCDIIARRFDPNGTPAVNDTTMDSGDFIANLTDEFTAAPSVAVGQSSVLMAWETADAIKAVALSPEGDHLQATETIVSTTDQLVGDPSVAALASGEFIVVWSESRPDGTTAVQGRFLDATGAPQVNPTTGDFLDFAVSWPEIGDAARPHVAATGDGRGFVAVWRFSEDFFAPSNLRARFFTNNGSAASVGNASVTNYTDANLYGPHAVYLGNNVALVAYSVQSTDDARLADGAVVFARFSSPTGGRVGTELIIPAQLPFETVVPALAKRADGAVLAAWHQCGGGGDGQGCGVLVQALRASGTPLGVPVVANTTRVGDQQGPSVAALGEPFVVAWTDGSMAAPDTDQLGVRGRLLYVEASANDGRLGASCGGADDAPCGESLTCIPGSTGTPMCHVTCSATDLIPCPGGGVCTTVGAASACVF